MYKLKYHKFIYHILFCLINVPFYTQQYGRGILLDESLYLYSPKSVPLLRGDFLAIPQNYSIKVYTPEAGTQGSYPTCSGWACAYSGRTILEAITNNWDKETIKNNVFSPSFIYNQIRPTQSCNEGASLLDALNIMKEFGALRLFDFEYNCEKQVTSEDKSRASKFKIQDFREIARRYDLNKSLKVKKSLSENKPVIVAIDCPNSFNNAGEIWIPDSLDYQYWGQGHAVTVIGYDDKKYGGAFEILNSWGTDWGNEGFAWIKYSDFEYFCHYAFELINYSKLNNSSSLSGSLKFISEDGTTLQSGFNGRYFKMKDKYVQGAKFELYLTNKQPAYVYALSSDLTFKVRKIFPLSNNMSALLPYSINNVAIPNENSYYLLDEVLGQSYLIFLYSASELNIHSIILNIERGDGDMWDRLNNSIPNKVPLATTIFSGGNTISFQGNSIEGEVIVVLVEFTHINKLNNKK